MLPWASRASRGAEKGRADDDPAIPKIVFSSPPARTFGNVLATCDEAILKYGAPLPVR